MILAALAMLAVPAWLRYTDTASEPISLNTVSQTVSTAASAVQSATVEQVIEAGTEAAGCAANLTGTLGEAQSCGDSPDTTPGAVTSGTRRVSSTGAVFVSARTNK